MEAKTLVKLRKELLRGQRVNTAARLVTAGDVRGSITGPMPDMRPGAMSMNQIMSALQKLEDRAMLAERFLAAGGLSEGELDALGLDPAAFAEAGRALAFIKKPIPDGLVILTFDDATRDHIEKAAPILEKYNARGVFFVCEMERALDGGEGFSNKDSFMSWEEIAELSRRGHEVANHSLHHRYGYFELTKEEQTAEIDGLAGRCAAYGIPRPVTFAYPGGRCERENAALLHERGIKWARGDMGGEVPQRAGQTAYDPYVDSPLAMASFNGAPAFGEAHLQRCLDQAREGRVAILAYHGVEDSDMLEISFEEQVKYLIEHGGRIITFRDLEEFIDPDLAYEFYNL